MSEKDGVPAAGQAMLADAALEVAYESTEKGALPAGRADFLVRLFLPFYLRAPDGGYPCRSGRNTYFVSIRGHVLDFAQSPGESGGGAMFHMMSGRLTGAKHADIPGAMLRFTELSIQFSKRIDGPKVTTEDTRKVRDIALRFLNHFLNVYRYVAQDGGARPLTRSELHQVRNGHALLIQANSKSS